MACPSSKQLELLLADDESDSPQTAELRLHVDACDRCRTWLFGDDSDDLVRAIRRAAHPSILPDNPGIDTVLPESIGNYRILRRIGEGGMGVVFEAQQQDPRRRVALKIIRGVRRADRDSIRLFRREIDALARLRDPRIAVIHESGCTASGEHYYAMELVEGAPLNEFVRTRNLDRRARLELFVRVCGAVWYAHQRGVIHRDLKPSNILVEPAGAPKVLDFGLARILNEAGAPATQTFDDHRLRGSLRYMSPEQTTGDPSATDVRTDVYSLGVVLFELLTDAAPLELEKLPLTDAIEAIRSHPPRRPAMLNPALRGDIETIILKALEKSAERRYAGVAELSADIERFLCNRPIVARPPSTTYLLRKFVARNRTTTALGAALVLLVIAFGAWMTVLYTRAQFNLRRAETAEQLATQEAQRARVEARTAQRVQDFLVRIFSAADPNVARGSNYTVRQVLDRGARDLDNLAGEPQVQASLQHSVALVYSSLGLNEQARPLFEKALATRRRVLGDSDALTATAAHDLAECLVALRDFDAADATFAIAAAAMRQNLDPQDWHFAAILRDWAGVREERGDFAGAESALREAVDRLRTAPHAGALLPGFLNTLAGVLQSQEKLDDAIPIMREALQISRNAGGGDSTAAASIQGNLAWLLASSGRLDEAQQLAEETLALRKRILPSGHPALASTYVTLGFVRLKRDQPAEAEPLFRQAYELRISGLTSRHPLTAEAAGFLAEALLALQRPAEALPLLELSNDIAAADPSAIRSRRHYLALLVHAAEQLGDERAASWRANLQASDQK